MRSGLALLLVACIEEPIDVPPPPPLECPAGQIEEAGSCRWILPRDPCPAHTRPALGEAECAPVGPGPCSDPFESDGSEWGCRPIAASDCGPGSAPSLGSTSCAPVGWTDCPVGFALEEGGCTEVVASEVCSGATRAALGSNGCVPIGDCEAPFPPANAIMVPGDHATIGEAVAAAANASVIAIDDGIYREQITIDRPLTLVGRCPERVIVETSTIPVVRAVDGSLAGVTLRGGRGVVAGGAFSMSDVVIEGALVGGVVAIGADADVRIQRAAIRTVRSGPEGARGRGASVERGASLMLDEVHVDDVREGGVVAVGAGSRVRLERSVIGRVRPSGAGDGGHGLIAAFGGSAIAASSLIADTSVHGVLAAGGGTDIVAMDLVVRDVGAGRGNAGVRVEDGARFSAERIAIRRATGVALLSNDAGSIAELTDAVLESSRAEVSGFAAGAFAAQSASLVLTRARIEEVPIGVVSVLDADLELESSALVGGSGSIGAFVQEGNLRMRATAAIGHELAGVTVEAGGFAHLDGALILGPSEPRRLNSAGVDVHEGSRALVERSAIARLDGQGLIVLDTSSATVSDSLIEAIRIGPSAATGAGAYDGGRLTMDRVRIEEVEGIGVLCADGPLSFRKSIVLGTVEVAAVTPTGLAAGGTTNIEGSALVGNAGVGAVLGGGRTTIDGALIAATSALSDGRFGHALVAESSTVAITDCALMANASVGAFFDRSRALVDTTLIAQNGVGVHAQSGSELIEAPAREPVELEIIFTGGVLFLDNETRVGTGQLPLPNPFAGLP